MKHLLPDENLMIYQNTFSFSEFLFGLFKNKSSYSLTRLYLPISLLMVKLFEIHTVNATASITTAALVAVVVVTAVVAVV